MFYIPGWCYDGVKTVFKLKVFADLSVSKTGAKVFVSYIQGRKKAQYNVILHLCNCNANTPCLRVIQTLHQLETSTNPPHQRHLHSSVIPAVFDKRPVRLILVGNNRTILMCHLFQIALCFYGNRRREDRVRGWAG